MVIKRFKYKGGTKRREQREFGITTLWNGIKKHGLTEGFKRNFRYAGELKKLGRRSDKRLQNSIDGAISRYNSKALLKNPDYINYKHPDLDIKNEQNQEVLKSLLKNAHNKGIRVLYDNGVGMRTRKSPFFHPRDEKEVMRLSGKDHAAMEKSANKKGVDLKTLYSYKNSKAGSFFYKFTMLFFTGK